MTDHTPNPKVALLEVIPTGARRRWTLEDKQRIVAESYGAPRRVSTTARRNGLSASQLFTWRRLARQGRLVWANETITFAPAIIEASTSNPPTLPECVEAVENSPSSQTPCPTLAPGRIEIVLKRGHRVIVDNDADATVLARVIAMLGAKAKARLFSIPTRFGSSSLNLLRRR
jgi:transposase